MREITSHIVNPVNDRIKIAVMDEPGAGGANHHYQLDIDGKQLVDIQFQKGPILQSGVNGLTHEALLAIVIDRLECFQKGPFPCKENRFALADLRNALFMLQRRTKDRMARGVEGKGEA